MKLKRRIRTILWMSLTLATLWACDDYTDDTPAPFDIINGKEDLLQQYYRSVLKRPVTISGQITNRKNSAPVAGVKITARLENSKTVYTTLSKEDGAFVLYVEGNLNYIIYGEKTGFNKTYYAQTVNSVQDTTFTISGNTSGYNIALRLVDTTPTFTTNQGVSITNSYSTDDLSFNGTHLIALDYHYSLFYYLDTNGSYVKSTTLSYYLNFFGAQGTDAFWAGTNSSVYLYKLDPKTGSVLSTIRCQISNPNLVDVEVYNSNIWMLGKSAVYKLSMSGNLEGTIDFTAITEIPDLRGVVQKNNYLYVLNYSFFDAFYVLYKIDPSTLSVVAKSYLPSAYNQFALHGLTFDKTNFWTINSQGSFMKFSSVE